MSVENMRLETKLIHAGEPRPLADGAVTLPIYQSSTFEFRGETRYDALRYIRLNNTPNHTCVSSKLAQIEGAELGIVTSSGMSAISTALLALVGEGEHLLAHDALYGGTFHFLKENFSKMGRKVSFFSTQDFSRGLEKLVRPETKAIYVEAISNPLLRVPPLREIAAFAKQSDLVSLIDNTFPSPVNFNPIELGYDVVLHSATKYLNGHTDIVGGCVLGRKGHVEQVIKLLNHLGGSMDPHTCFLLNRGLKTLALRVRCQSQSALQLAQALESHPRIRRVSYPGLPSHPEHARAAELFRGAGGMLSFELEGTVTETDQFLSRLKLATSAPSLGGVETLVTRPATTSHSGMSAEDRRKSGIEDSLVRVSVGLEDPRDLIADFVKALDTK